jgi:tRNA(Ile)-lysidine synthase TilS/MesJ
MEDASNLSKDYTRNKIRLDVIPTLSNIAGGHKALHRRMTQLSEQSVHLDQWINEEVR